MDAHPGSPFLEWRGERGETGLDLQLLARPKFGEKGCSLYVGSGTRQKGRRGWP